MLGLVATSNAAPPDFASHPPPGHLSPAEGSDHECLASFMSGLSEELAADGLLVACHHETDPPMLLFSDGECNRDPEIEQSLLRSAVRSLEGRSQRAQAVSAEEDHPAGVVFTAKLMLRNLAVTLTSLRRDRRLGASRSSRERLARLLPIVASFFTMWSQRRDIAHRLSGLEAAIEQSGSRTLLLDRAGRVIFANSSGQEFLASGRGLSAERGRLTAPNLTETLRLHSAIEHLCSAGRCDLATPVLAVKRRHLRPLMITLGVAGTDPDDQNEPTIVARIFDPEHDTSELIEPACRFYGLSPSETRLTRCIAEGHSLAEAAIAMGVREQTARSYLKQIFLKTETNRQAELAALMLRSAVRLAPNCRTQVF